MRSHGTQRKPCAIIKGMGTACVSGNTGAATICSHNRFVTASSFAMAQATEHGNTSYLDAYFRACEIHVATWLTPPGERVPSDPERYMDEEYMAVLRPLIELDPWLGDWRPAFVAHCTAYFF